MTREEKIDIIIVNIFQKMLGIKDNNVLLQIHDSLKLKDINTKEKILRDLYKKTEEQKKVFGQMQLEIKKVKNKIYEGFDEYFEDKEINNLIKL